MKVRVVSWGYNSDGTHKEPRTQEYEGVEKISLPGHGLFLHFTIQSSLFIPMDRIYLVEWQYETFDEQTPCDADSQESDSLWEETY